MQHLLDGRLQANLKKQKNDADPRQQIDEGIGFQIVELPKMNDPEVSEYDSGHQFSQHGRLAEPLCHMAAQLGGRQYDGQREHHARHRVRVVLSYERGKRACEGGVGSKCGK